MFDNITVEQFNENFMSLIDDPAMFKKAQVAASQYVRMKLREEGVMRRYFNDLMERVTVEDPRYQIDPENADTGYLLIDKEPDTYALRMTYRAQPRAEYIMGQKFIVPFAKYESPVFEKQEMELRNIRMPITDVIRSNLVYDLQEAEDKYFLKVLETAIEVTENQVVSDEGELSKRALKNLLNKIESDRLRVDAFIMSQTTINDALTWEHSDIGDEVREVVINGVKWPTLFGRRLVTTTNSDVLPKGVVYALTAPNFLGTAATLGDPTFWLKKEKDMLQMAAWYYAGFNIGNIKGAARLILTGDSGEGEGETQGGTSN